jgi:hypothetical protein
VKAGDIGVSMNYALVRVAGLVRRDPYVSRRGGAVDYCSFLVDDGSGSLRVAARGDVAAALVAGGRLPVRGDRVVVDGKVQVRADGTHRLWLQTPEQLGE